MGGRSPLLDTFAPGGMRKSSYAVRLPEILSASGSWAMSTAAGTASMMACSSSARARSRASLCRSVSAARSRSRNPARAAEPMPAITSAAGMKSADPTCADATTVASAGAPQEGVPERGRERDGHEPRGEPARPRAERHREQEQDEGDTLEQRPERRLEGEHDERQARRHGDRCDDWEARGRWNPEAFDHARDPWVPGVRIVADHGGRERSTEGLAGALPNAEAPAPAMSRAGDYRRSTRLARHGCRRGRIACGAWRQRTRGMRSVRGVVPSRWTVAARGRGHDGPGRGHHGGSPADGLQQRMPCAGAGKRVRAERW